MSTTVSMTAQLANDFKSWSEASTWVYDVKKYAPSIISKSSKSTLDNSISTLNVKSLDIKFTSPFPDSSSSEPISNQPSTVPSIYSNNFFEIRESPKGGLGVFAITNIPEGKVVHREMPLAKGLRSTVDWMVAAMSDEDQKKYFSLWAYEKLSEDRAMSIFLTNQFAVGRGQGAVYHIASRFNHSHNPDLDYRYEKETYEMIFTAQRDILADTEITLSYGGSPTQLYDHYGFFCACGHCLGFTQAEADVMEKERETESIRRSYEEQFATNTFKRQRRLAKLQAKTLREQKEQEALEVWRIDGMW